MSEDDSLDGYRARPLTEDDLALLEAVRHDGRQDLREKAHLADVVRRFMATELGRFIQSRVDEAEQNFLEQAKQLGHTDNAAFKLAHFDYLVAMQAMLWFGQAVMEGEEAGSQLATEYEDQE